MSARPSVEQAGEIFDLLVEQFGGDLGERAAFAGTLSGQGQSTFAASGSKLSVRAFPDGPAKVVLPLALAGTKLAEDVEQANHSLAALLKPWTRRRRGAAARSIPRSRPSALAESES